MPRQAEVIFKTKKVGVLEETANGGSRFTYDPEWKEQIACCFPVSQREHEWRFGLHPFFQHLGTEGWLREKQARTANIPEQDDLGLLLRYGEDCIGAISVKTQGEAPLIDGASSGDPIRANRTVSGVQPKLLVFKKDGQYLPAESTGPAPYIAKFNSESVTDIVRNEALSLSWISKVLGQKEVTEFEVGTVETGDQGRAALIVKRFDRTDKDERLRLEDFAQILVIPRKQDYSGKYDSSYEAVANAIREHSSRPDIDVLSLYKRIISFAIVGNCDAHLKNFSLLETKTGLRLSPVYDVINSLIYPQHYDQTLALTLNGKKFLVDDLSRKVFEEFGKNIGLSSAAIKLAFDEIKKGVEAADSYLTPSPAEPADGFKHRYADVVRNGCQKILTE